MKPYSHKITKIAILLFICWSGFQLFLFWCWFFDVDLDHIYVEEPSYTIADSYEGLNICVDGTIRYGKTVEASIKELNQSINGTFFFIEKNESSIYLFIPDKNKSEALIDGSFTGDKKGQLVSTNKEMKERLDFLQNYTHFIYYKPSISLWKYIFSLLPFGFVLFLIFYLIYKKKS